MFILIWFKVSNINKLSLSREVKDPSENVQNTQIVRVVGFFSHIHFKAYSFYPSRDKNMQRIWIYIRPVNLMFDVWHPWSSFLSVLEINHEWLACFHVDCMLLLCLPQMFPSNHLVMLVSQHSRIKERRHQGGSRAPPPPRLLTTPLPPVAPLTAGMSSHGTGSARPAVGPAGSSR